MKILFLQDHRETGGAARAAGRLRSLAESLGHTTAVACGDGPATQDVFRVSGKLPRGIGRVWQICVPRPLRNHWFRSRAQAQWQEVLQRFRPDRIWVHNLQGAHKWGWSTALVRQALAHAPVIWTLHDMSPLGAGSSYWPEEQLPDESRHSPLVSLFGGTPTSRLTLSAPSRWLADLASRGTGRSCKVLSNPVDVETFSPGDRRAARQKTGLPAEGRIFLAGAERVDDPRKGLALLDGLTPDLKKAGILTAVFGRNGRPQTGQIQLGVLRGDVAMREAYRAADLYLHLAHQDNAPCQIQESLACGTPVLAFGVGGIPEMILPGQTGFLARKDSLREALHRLVELRPDALTGLREFCRKEAVQRWSPQAVIPDLKFFLESSVG